MDPLSNPPDKQPQAPKLKGSTHEDIILQINHLKDLFNKYTHTASLPTTHPLTTTEDKDIEKTSNNPPTDDWEKNTMETTTENKPYIDWNQPLMTIFDTAIQTGEARISKALIDEQTLATTDWNSFIQQNSTQTCNMSDLWTKEITAIYADQTRPKFEENRRTPHLTRLPKDRPLQSHPHTSIPICTLLHKRRFRTHHTTFYLHNTGNLAPMSTEKTRSIKNHPHRRCKIPRPKHTRLDHYPDPG